MILEHLSSTNPAYECIVGSTVVEYDIRNAGATAIKHIKGEEIYNNLMTLSKHDRVVKIGLMMRDEPGLSERVNKLMLEWLNFFIDGNKIKTANIVATTRDSIIIHKKIPTKLNFGDVEFRNKDGAFSSMYRTGRLTVFFDSMRDVMLVKGLKSEFDANLSPFFKVYLSKFLYKLETIFSKGDGELFVTLRNMRDRYIHSSDINIYRDVFNKDMIGIRFVSKPDDIIYLEDSSGLSDDESNDYIIAKEINYLNIVMPLMRSVQMVF